MVSAQVTDAPVSLRDRIVSSIVIRERSIIKATAKTRTNVFWFHFFLDLLNLGDEFRVVVVHNEVMLSDI